MGRHKLGCKHRQALLQLIQRPLAIIQSALQELQQSRGIRITSTIERLAHTRQSLCNGKQVLGAIEPSLFEVVEQPLNRTCKRISGGRSVMSASWSRISRLQECANLHCGGFIVPANRQKQQGDQLKAVIQYIVHCKMQLVSSQTTTYL